MRVRFNRFLYRQNFILDEERIKSLVKVLQNRVGEPSISADCADGGVRSFENVENFLQYENPKGRRIISLDFDSINSEEELAAGVEFRSPEATLSGSSSSVRIVVRGAEDPATMVMKEIEEIVLGNQPWYSWIYKLNESAWFVMYVIAAYFVLNKFGLVSLSDPNLDDIFSLTAVSVCMTLGTRYGIRRLFDTAVFLIGQEKTKYKTKEWLRKIIIGVLITLMISLAIIPLLRFLFFRQS